MVLRRGWKIGRGQRVMLVPGRIDPAKGQLTLVEAARMLTNGGLRGVVFVLAGDNRQHFDYAKKIAAQAEAHGVAHLIRQIGVCPDMAGAYLATDFVAIPQIEPPAFPLAAAEAMAMARPVIASNVGALPEIVLAPPHVLRIRAHRLARRAGRSGEFRARDRGGARRRSLGLQRDRHARAAACESILHAGAHRSGGARPLCEPVRRPRLNDCACAAKRTIRRASGTDSNDRGAGRFGVKAAALRHEVDRVNSRATARRPLDPEADPSNPDRIERRPTAKSLRSRGRSPCWWSCRRCMQAPPTPARSIWCASSPAPAIA